jgi:hypothetical protein
MLNYTLTFTTRVNSISDEIFKEDLCLTACKQYCLAPAHAGQHKATSPTRKSLAVMLKKQTRLNLTEH